MALDDALTAWRNAIGSAGVLSAAAAHEAYGRSATGAKRAIAAALRPASSEQVPDIVAIAHAHRVALYPISTGRNWGYGGALPVRDGCVILDLSALTGIRDFDAALGVVTLEPGVTQAMLAAFLDAEGSPFLVPVTGAGPSASIVGNALERGYGITPVADHFQAVQSLEAVLADGRVYRPALAVAGAADASRLFKWGVGPYLDGLLTQSNFAVVTAMTIALARRPESMGAFTCTLREGAAPASMVDGVREVLHRLPGIVGGINLMNRHRVLAMSVPFPRDALGADGLLPQAVVASLAERYRVAPWTLFGTLYGTRRVVRAARAEIRRAIGGQARGLVFVTPAIAARVHGVARRVPMRRARAFAQRLAILRSSLDLVAGRPSDVALRLAYWRSSAQPAGGDAGRLDPERDGCGLIWYTPLVAMKADVVHHYVEFATRTMRGHGIEPLITLTSLSDRCFDSSAPLLFDRGDPRAVERAQACYRALLVDGAREGFVPYRLGIDAMDWLARPGIVAWDTVAAIKRALDPHAILSPGRYGIVTDA
jgi:4-cresol dehydrogenase (hydroxylating) flavoprotein subunit